MEVTKANLATYLAGLTPSATPYPIEITETVASDWGNSATIGTVGGIIRASTPSGVYLDLGLTIIPSSVTDMRYTFWVCTPLTTAPIIPSSVTDMRYTFLDCTSLTTVPVIPNSVTYMGYTFHKCTSLHTIQNFAVDVDNCEMINTFQNCPALANIYVTTLTESTWHLLYTDTDATGTDYTIYNPDGTVAGSGTVAGTSQVLTLYGKSDELVISANITPTLAVETATSQVQWHKSGLPYDDELMIFNAKNPDTVISNFITVNRAGEEFLGRSKDSYPIPTDAVLQYSFDEIKQLPDNPTGTVYLRDNDWTTVDGWVRGHASITVSTESQKLKVVYDGTRPDTGLSIEKTGLTYNGKFIVGRIQSTVPIVSISYYTGTGVTYLKLNKKTEYEAIFYGYMQSTYIPLLLYMNFNQLTAKTCWIESLYIGDGSYLEPVIDNSYSEAHAENHGVIPVDGVCGKAGYFNNSYMIAPRPALGDDITIYFWAKFDAFGSHTILQSRTVGGKGLTIYLSSLDLYRFEWRGNQKNFTGYTPPVNTWHHVCMKMNATTKVLKINGETKVTLTGTYGVTENLASTIWSGLAGIGGTLSGAPLTGALDGLKIIPRYTTDDEDIGEYKARANLPKFYATADKWKTARTIAISDADGTNTGTAVPVDGSENETLKLPPTIKASITGNATTASNGFTNIRRSTNFTLPTYLDGTHISVANTHATNTITCTLPTGQTMYGQNVFYLNAGSIIELELLGTSWLMPTQKDTRLIIGEEYLFPFRNYYLINEYKISGPKWVALCGDSTFTTGSSALNNASSTNNSIATEIFRLIYYHGLNGTIGVSAFATSGETCKTWLSKIDAQIANQQYNAWIIGYGLNDNSYGIGSLESDMRACLAKIKANNSKAAIILCAPNNITAANPTMTSEWSGKVSDLYRRIAKDYQACFIDFYNMYNDVSVDSVVGGFVDEYMDTFDATPYGGTGYCHIHPKWVYNAEKAQKIFDLLFPPSILRNYSHTSVDSFKSNPYYRSAEDGPLCISVVRGVCYVSFHAELISNPTGWTEVYDGMPESQRFYNIAQGGNQLAIRMEGRKLLLYGNHDQYCSFSYLVKAGYYVP